MVLLLLPPSAVASIASSSLACLFALQILSTVRGFKSARLVTCSLACVFVTGRRELRQAGTQEGKPIPKQSGGQFIAERRSQKWTRSRLLLQQHPLRLTLLSSSNPFSFSCAGLSWPVGSRSQILTETGKNIWPWRIRAM